VQSPSDDLLANVVALYGRKAVSGACLLLQERTRLDVNVLLMAAWCGAKRRQPLDDQSVRQAGALVADWHREIVIPLRTVRRRLKNGPAPAPSEQTDQLRAKLQALEISAELVELAQLQTLADNLERLACVDASGATAMSNMLRVVEMYAGRPANTEERNAVNAIATEAMDFFS